MTTGYVFWVDKKLNLILEWLLAGRFRDDIDDLVEDLRLCHDQTRELFGIDDESRRQEEIDLYRVRCNKILIAVGLLKKENLVVRHQEYLEALEGVLLDVMRKGSGKGSGKE